MQANRTRMRDAAVSPVVATILMVAITVVLAATAYSWTSSLGTRGAGAPASVALVSDGSLAAPAAHNPQKAYSVTATSPGLRWSNLALQLDGATATYVPALRSGGAPDLDAWCVLDGAGACEASAVAAGLVEAGDRVMLEDAGLANAKLRIVDPAANTVVYTLTVQ